MFQKKQICRSCYANGVKMRSAASLDLRVKKTLDSIQAAFKKLVLEMPYSGVTVSALCSEARIGRKTFYVYFQSLGELLE